MSASLDPTTLPLRRGSHFVSKRVNPPLLVLGAPATLLRRVSSPQDDLLAGRAAKHVRIRRLKLHSAAQTLPDPARGGRLPILLPPALVIGANSILVRGTPQPAPLRTTPPTPRIQPGTKLRVGRERLMRLPLTAPRATVMRSLQNSRPSRHFTSPHAFVVLFPADAVGGGQPLRLLKNGGRCCRVGSCSWSVRRDSSTGCCVRRLCAALHGRRLEGRSRFLVVRRSSRRFLRRGLAAVCADGLSRGRVVWSCLVPGSTAVCSRCSGLVSGTGRGNQDRGTRASAYRFGFGPSRRVPIPTMKPPDLRVGVSSTASQNSCGSSLIAHPPRAGRARLPRDCWRSRRAPQGCRRSCPGPPPILSVSR